MVIPMKPPVSSGPQKVPSDLAQCCCSSLRFVSVKHSAKVAEKNGDSGSAPERAQGPGGSDQPGHVDSGKHGAAFRGKYVCCTELCYFCKTVKSLDISRLQGCEGHILIYQYAFLHDTKCVWKLLLFSFFSAAVWILLRRHSWRVFEHPRYLWSVWCWDSFLLCTTFFTFQPDITQILLLRAYQVHPVSNCER